MPILTTSEERTAFFGLLIVALNLIGLYKNRQTHKLINSRMTELLKLTRTAAKAEGVIEGVATQKEEEKKL